MRSWGDHGATIYALPAGSRKVTPVLAVDFVGGETIYILSVSLGFNS